MVRLHVEVVTRVRMLLDNRLEADMAAVPVGQEGIDVMSEESCFRSGVQVDIEHVLCSTHLFRQGSVRWPFPCLIVGHSCEAVDWASLRRLALVTACQPDHQMLAHKESTVVPARGAFATAVQGLAAAVFPLLAAAVSQKVPMVRLILR